MSDLKYTGQNTMFADVFGTLLKQVEEYSVLKTAVAAATDGKEQAVEAFINSSTDPEIVKLREGIEKLRQKMLQIADKKVADTSMSEGEVENAKTNMLKIRGEVNEGINALTGMMKYVSPNGDEAAESLIEQIRELTKGTRGRAPGSKNTGEVLPKVPVNVKITGGNLKDEHYETMGAAAKALNITLKEFQLAFAQSAGVEHAEIHNVKTPQSFQIKPHEDGATYVIVTTPKDVKKPGRKAKTEVAA